MTDDGEDFEAMVGKLSYLDVAMLSVILLGEPIQYLLKSQWASELIPSLQVYDGVIASVFRRRFPEEFFDLRLQMDPHADGMCGIAAKLNRIDPMAAACVMALVGFYRAFLDEVEELATLRFDGEVATDSSGSWTNGPLVACDGATNFTLMMDELRIADGLFPARDSFRIATRAVAQLREVHNQLENASSETILAALQELAGDGSSTLIERLRGARFLPVRRAIWKSLGDFFRREV